MYEEKDELVDMYNDFDQIKEDIIKKKEEKKEKEKIKHKDDIIICKEYNNIPKIIFQNEQYLDIILDRNESGKTINTTIGKFINNYIVKGKEEEKHYLKCHLHNEMYEKYCIDCKKDLCNECISLAIEHKNNNHTLTPFRSNEISLLINEVEKKVKKYEQKIQEYISFKSSENLEQENSIISKSDDLKNKNEEEKIIYLINLILKLYNDYPCQNLLESIESANDYLSNPEKNKEKNSIYNSNISYEEKTIQIDNWKMLKKNNNFENILGIDIKEQNLYNLNIFNDLYFPNLKILLLEENNIEDIGPLKYAKFNNLVELSLARNKINDENAKIIGECNFPNLEFINIYFNYITNYSIFKELSKFKKLEKLFIGGNLFDEKTVNKSDIYEFPNLLEFGARNGVFCESTIDTISQFKFNKLEILYLQSNNLHSLTKFIGIIQNECPDLKELWFYNNYFTEFFPIYNENGYFKNLKVIRLEKNKIDNIEKLKEFIEKFPGLRMNLSNNKIDKNDPKNISIIETIKNMKGFNIEI